MTTSPNSDTEFYHEKSLDTPYKKYDSQSRSRSRSPSVSISFTLLSSPSDCISVTSLDSFECTPAQTWFSTPNNYQTSVINSVSLKAISEEKLTLNKTESTRHFYMRERGSSMDSLAEDFRRLSLNSEQLELELTEITQRPTEFDQRIHIQNEQVSSDKNLTAEAQAYTNKKSQGNLNSSISSSSSSSISTANVNHGIGISFNEKSRDYPTFSWGHLLGNAINQVANAIFSNSYYSSEDYIDNGASGDLSAYDRAARPVPGLDAFCANMGLAFRPSRDD